MEAGQDCVGTVPVCASVCECVCAGGGAEDHEGVFAGLGGEVVSRQSWGEGIEWCHCHPFPVSLSPHQSPVGWFLAGQTCRWE